VCEYHKRAGRGAEFACMRFDAIMPVLDYKRPDPRMVVAIKHGVFGAAHNQTVEFCHFFSINSAASVAKIGK
jgi:hypothetical protein